MQCSWVVLAHGLSSGCSKAVGGGLTGADGCTSTSKLALIVTVIKRLQFSHGLLD